MAFSSSGRSFSFRAATTFVEISSWSVKMSEKSRSKR
jgi:hypothetical protein